jgi:hypothetical protein
VTALPEPDPTELAGPSRQIRTRVPAMFDVAAPLLTALTFGLVACAADYKGHHILTAMFAGGALLAGSCVLTSVWQ